MWQNCDSYVSLNKSLRYQGIFILRGTVVLPTHRQLDMSFNVLRKVEGLEQLTRLKKLFLLHNKISSIANLEHLTGLEMLELGSNRIRVRYEGTVLH